jgi:hypothetical protein
VALRGFANSARVALPACTGAAGRNTARVATPALCGNRDLVVRFLRANCREVAVMATAAFRSMAEHVRSWTPAKFAVDLRGALSLDQRDDRSPTSSAVTVSALVAHPRSCGPGFRLRKG